MKRVLWSTLLAAVCMSTVGLSAQVNSAYAVDTLNNLYQVDLATATTTFVATVGFFEGLAISPKGELFGTDSVGNLYRINRTTQATVLIGNTGLGDIEGLDFLNQKLLAVTHTSGPAEVVSLDIHTAKPTLIVTASTGIGSTLAMAVATSRSLIVCATDDPSGLVTYHSLYSIDLITGDVKFMGTLNIGAGVLLPALDFNSLGQLFGLDANGNEWRIDPATAAVRFVGNTGGNFWLDMKAITPPR